MVLHKKYRPHSVEDVWNNVFDTMRLEEYYYQYRWYSQSNRNGTKAEFEAWTIFYNQKKYQVRHNKNIVKSTWEIYRETDKKRSIRGEERRMLRRFAIHNRKDEL